MKRIYLYITFALLIGLAACDDYRDNYTPSDSVYVSNNGYDPANPILIPDTDNPHVIKISVIKSGINGTSAVVKLAVNTDDLKDFNTSSGLSEGDANAYKLLPAECYSIPQTTISIEGNDQYSVFEVVLYPASLKQLTNLKQYILPIRIGESTIPISQEALPALLHFEME